VRGACPAEPMASIERGCGIAVAGAHCCAAKSEAVAAVTVPGSSLRAEWGNARSRPHGTPKRSSRKHRINQ